MYIYQWTGHILCMEFNGCMCVCVLAHGAQDAMVIGGGAVVQRVAMW